MNGNKNDPRNIKRKKRNNGMRKREIFYIDKSMGRGIPVTEAFLENTKPRENNIFKTL